MGSCGTTDEERNQVVEPVVEASLANSGAILVGGAAGPGFFAICCAIFCPLIFTLIKCTENKGGGLDVVYVLVVGLISFGLSRIHPLLAFVGSLFLYGSWGYASYIGADYWLCPMSAPGGILENSKSRRGSSKRSSKRSSRKSSKRSSRKK